VSSSDGASPPFIPSHGGPSAVFCTTGAAGQDQCHRTDSGAVHTGIRIVRRTPLHYTRRAVPCLASCALRRGSLAENASTVKHKCTERTNQEGRGAGIKTTNRYHQRTSAAAGIRPYLESVDRQKGLKWQTVQRVDTPDNRPYYACPASNRFIARYLYLLFLLNATGSLRKCGPPRDPSPFGRPEWGQ